MLEERKSRKVGQTFSKLANEASTELHNANYSMQPNLSKIDFSIEKRALFTQATLRFNFFTLPCLSLSAYNSLSANWRLFPNYQVGEDEVDGWKRRVVTLITEVV